MPVNINVTAPEALGPVPVPAPGDARNSAGIAAIAQKLLNMVAGGLQTATPVGTVIAFAGTAAPAGWLLCNGAELNQVTYPALYGVIGASYGSQTASTFTLPDLRGRMAIGAGQGVGLSNRVRGQPGGEEVHALTVQEMPAHSHLSPTGNGITGTTYEVPPVGAAQGGFDYVGSAPTETVGANAGHNTMSPFLVLNYIIRS